MRWQTREPVHLSLLDELDLAARRRASTSRCFSCSLQIPIRTDRSRASRRPRHRVEDWRGVFGGGLSGAPRFLWQCLTRLTLGPSPAPASSHVACGFPALRAPVGFETKALRPTSWACFRFWPSHSVLIEEPQLAAQAVPTLCWRALQPAQHNQFPQRHAFAQHLDYMLVDRGNREASERDCRTGVLDALTTLGDAGRSQGSSGSLI